MAPAGPQGYPRATIGTPKGDRVDQNWTTPVKEDTNQQEDNNKILCKTMLKAECFSGLLFYRQAPV